MLVCASPVSCSQQKLYAQPTRNIPAWRVVSVRAIARPRRVNGVDAARNVALSRSMYAVLIIVPVPVASSTAAIAPAVPRTGSPGLKREPAGFLALLPEPVLRF